MIIVQKLEDFILLLLMRPLLLSKPNLAFGKLGLFDTKAKGKSQVSNKLNKGHSIGLPNISSLAGLF